MLTCAFVIYIVFICLYFIHLLHLTRRPIVCGHLTIFTRSCGRGLDSVASSVVRALHWNRRETDSILAWRKVYAIPFLVDFRSGLIRFLIEIFIKTLQQIDITTSLIYIHLSINLSLSKLTFIWKTSLEKSWASVDYSDCNSFDLFQQRPLTFITSYRAVDKEGLGTRMTSDKSKTWSCSVRLQAHFPRK
jgi:hypothetical protein